MTDQQVMPLRKILLRNGFGFDIENVDSKPLWTWKADADPREDPADIGVFVGLVINIPFFKIFFGDLYY